MIKIEITIPLFYNDGKQIEFDKLQQIKRELLTQFGGLTISNKNNGYWVDTIIYNDTNKIYTVICEPTKDNLSWIKGFKKWLENKLEQKSIFIVISKCEVLE